MRTIQVINVRWFNATAWYGLYLAKLLQESGHETIVLAIPDTPTWEKAKKFGFNPVYLPLNSVNPFTYPSTYFKLKKLIRQFRPDIINCHRGEGFLLWAIAKYFWGNFALVRTRGDQRLPKKNLPNIFLHKFVSNAIISTNSRMTKHFSHAMGVKKQQLYTVLGGVDTDVFTYTETGRKKVRQEFNFPNSSFVIGLVGRYDEVKGQKDLIQAVGKLKANLLSSGCYKDIRLLFIGHPTPNLSQEELQSAAKAAGISEHTYFTGFRKDIAACISALDAGVIASRWSEAIARAALEIMACKIPLLATTVGVMPDLLPNCALYTPGNVDELAEKLRELIFNQVLRDNLINDSSKRMSFLTGKSFLQQTLSIYERAIASIKNKW